MSEIRKHLEMFADAAALPGRRDGDAVRCEACAIALTDQRGWRDLIASMERVGMAPDLLCDPCAEQRTEDYYREDAA